MLKQNILNQAFGIEDVDTLGNIEDIQVAASQAESENGQLMDEFDTCTKAMNTLVHDEHTLDSMYGVVEKGIETEEGIDSNTSAVVNEAVENICRRYGFSRKSIRSFNVANESFSSKEGRINAARNLKVTLEGVFGKIKEWIIKIWEWIKKQWNKLFNNNEKRLDTIKDLMEYINNALAGLKDNQVQKLTVLNSNESGTKHLSYSAYAEGIYKRAEFINENYNKFCNILDGLIEAKSLHNLKPFDDPSKAFNIADVASVTIEGLNDFKKALNDFASLHDALKTMLNDLGKDVEDRINKLEELFGTIDEGRTDSEGNARKQAETGWWAKIKNTKVADFLGGRGMTDPRKVLESIRNMSNELTTQTNEIITGCFKAVNSAASQLKKQGL